MIIQQSSRYPRNGRFAILCEGDLAGYEADLLESWTTNFSDIGLVDVWPCGTKTAIYGVSDAIGRSIPLLVIEDRDHRTPEVATKDCRGNLEDRKKRGVKIAGWRTWERSEIENYFLEPSILFPVFANVFAISEAQVAEHLQQVLSITACDQALQMVLSEARSVFPKGEREVGGINKATGRPIWKSDLISAPDNETVKTLLGDLLKDCIANLPPKRLPSTSDFLESFDSKLELWTNLKVENEEWKINWAGKEVLYWLRKKLTAEVGWPDKSNAGKPKKIDWESLGQNEEGEIDRKIERALQPLLVDRFLTQLSNGGLSPKITAEWNSIIAEIQ